HLRGQHAPDLCLVRVAISGEDHLYLAWLVLEDGHAAFLEHVEDGAACLGHSDGAARVAAHEKLFDRSLRGWVVREQRAEVIGDGQQALSVPAGNRDHGAAGEDEVGFGEQGEACAGEAWVDAEDQSVVSTRHVSIRFYTCAATRSRTSEGMSKLA